LHFARADPPPVPNVDGTSARLESPTARQLVDDIHKLRRSRKPVRKNDVSYRSLRSRAIVSSFRRAAFWLAIATKNNTPYGRASQHGNTPTQVTVAEDGRTLVSGPTVDGSDRSAWAKKTLPVLSQALLLLLLWGGVRNLASPIHRHAAIKWRTTVQARW